MKKIPDSELEIMMIIWGTDESVSSDYIMERIDKTWTKTTVLNLLTRLCNRGFLECRKNGRFNIYTSLVDKADYLENESKNFLEKMYANSLIGLVSSLYNGKTVSKDDLADLKKFIEEAN